MPVSVVVPVLNEEKNILNTLTTLRKSCSEADEIIVVDGGSTDQTRTQAERCSDVVISAERGRARQLNAGAAIAKHPVLWFVHADTLVPECGAAIVRQTLENRHWGRFDVRFTSSRRIFSAIAFCMNLRSRLSGVATGDQAIFVTREYFDRVDGFPEIPLMEDVDLSKALRAFSPPVCLTETVTTSSRRWESEGIVRTILLMWKLRFLHFVGTPATKLARQYRSLRS